MFKLLPQTLHFANRTGLAATIIIVFSFSIISQSHATAQTTARSDLAKILIGDSIHALQKGDSSGALLQMKLADQELASAGNGTAIQSAKILVEDAIQAILNTNITKAILHLNIVDHQLAFPAGSVPRQQSTSLLKSATSTQRVNANTSSNFLLYQNAREGVVAQYPASWTKEERDNFLFGNGVSNIVTFIPQGGKDKSGGYHTYLAIAIDPHPDKTLSKYLQTTIQGYESLKGFSLISASTNVFLSRNPAYSVVYYDDADHIESKTLEVGTIVGKTAYYIQYQADPVVYNNYLPLVYKMIGSLKINMSLFLLP